MQRAVPVLTMRKVKNVIVNLLIYSGVQSCFCVWGQKGCRSSQIQSFARITVCLNTVLQWHGAAQTSGGRVLEITPPPLAFLRIADSADCSEHQLTTFLRSTYNYHSCHYVHEMNTTIIATVI